ncbi:baseplate J-like protein [Cellulophaga phage phi47:1]|uniref:hypothetical protein n=1 Tax=Cellulophaga phage phiSM TaxID=756280 RepID=UPI0002B791E2|nr:hypothetical protein CEPG_00026 [Cellulophaga phage phiSM]AGF91643.1 hypothetical protein CDPG_00039 [Cellulophaga phage phi47:1]AGO47758.1 baseplate J-like protein [Cellulophaga phage phi3ST:2]AGO49266.1 baseplate J-like protein [Cellulophaga phage phi38:2]AGO49346.1 baseplate J-like protein [Cellulophaga phage phi3:1]AGH07774.1 hypothetical protein CEPG_00026 [Cellulophaga phage phiSM]
MANIPTIFEINANIANDLKNKLDLSDSGLKKTLDVFAGVLAAQFKLTYLALSDVQNQLFVDTADTSENGGTLDRWGDIWLGRIRNSSSSGVYEISLDFAENSVLRQNLTFKSNDESFSPSMQYILDEQETLTSSNNTVQIRSLLGGSQVLLEVGDTLTINEPVIGVDQVVTVVAVVEQPLEEESVDDYRSAILQSIQLEPQGGAKTDYRLWASDAQGVKSVYPYVKNEQAGTVQVYLESTVDDSIDGYGTPSQALIDSVIEVINFDPDETKPINDRGRLPIQVTLEVLSIAPNPVDITITGLVDVTDEIKLAVRENLEDYLSEIRPYVAGADLARNKNDIVYSARAQSVVADVLSSDNFFTSFSLLVNGVNQNSFLFSRENIPYLRNLTFD